MKASSGKYEVRLSGKVRRAATQPEALALVFEYCATINPKVVEELAKVQKPKLRLIARDWRDLNPDRPDLSEKRTRVFGDYWIYNTRSGDKVLRLMDFACRLAGIKYLEDVWVDCALFDKRGYKSPRILTIAELL